MKSMLQAWQCSELNAESGAYLETLYDAYLESRESVSPEWQQYFKDLQARFPGQADTNHEIIREAFIATNPGREPRHFARGVSQGERAFAPLESPSVTVSCGGGDTHKLIAVMDLIYAYRYSGHYHSKLDPLNLKPLPDIAELTLAYHGLDSQDLKQEFEIRDLNFLGPVKLKTIVAELERIYCGHVGIEYMHMTNHEEVMWVRSQVETKNSKSLTPEQQRWLYQRLVAADGLEKYLGMRFAGQKRFSLEGGDSLIPSLGWMLQQAVEDAVEEVLIGMAHRGRLNVLVNVVGKSVGDLIDEFEGKHHSSLLSGDVKYHNGFSANIRVNQHPLYVALAFNPSHLEIVTPVVSGTVRSRQDRRDKERTSVLPIMIHGDAAFTAQGVIMESFNMAETRGFTTQGAVHIVVNNQLGFTTSKHEDARSAFYCTAIAKMVEAPIFHVNGDDPEAVLFVTQLAIDYRMKFKKDVVIDLVCYRLHGHNEADEPSGTQPLMYQAIKQHPAPYQLYATYLEQADVLSSQQADAILKDCRAQLERGGTMVELVDAEQAKMPVNWSLYLGVPWDVATSTKVKKGVLLELARQLDQIPAGFTLQAQVAKTIADRQQMTQEKLPVNWGYAELLAYATLINEGFSLRLCGQDTARGTFAHRHAVWHDYKNGDAYVPLKQLAKPETHVEIIDSVLSEGAVLAFEYGYASSDPKTLVIWEAQFGDFANNAQVVIDQFISSAEEKWGLLCGLTLFLPHGFEGMGAEHSSARLERFLQLCAHDNIQVCVPTTPAQHFHLLRRQMIRPYRKPLIVMTPKSLLRHPLVTSTVDELAEGEFKLVMDEIDNLKPNAWRRVIFCQGKVYYDLLMKRREAKIDDIAVIRIEQLYPFPTTAIQAVLQKYAVAKEFIWCQEEPQNQGAWSRLQGFLEELLPKGQRVSYVGRKSFAAPAVGYPKLHKEQQEVLVNEALGIVKSA